MDSPTYSELESLPELQRTFQRQGRWYLYYAVVVEHPEHGLLRYQDVVGATENQDPSSSLELYDDQGRTACELVEPYETTVTVTAYRPRST